MSVFIDVKNTDLVIFAGYKKVFGMRFKVGDKVKFLNENGGGKVVAIVDSKLVKVETDDGFELTSFKC